MQSGIELPYQAVRYQIADAIHLVLHLGRHEGRRLVRELIRIGRYDVDHDRYERDELFSQESRDQRSRATLPALGQSGNDTKRES